jgi:hypothetical protein
MKKTEMRDTASISIEGTGVQPVDLSEMILTEDFENDGRKLHVIRPIAFTPKLDEETKQFYTIEDDSIGINVFAYTREALMKNLIEQLFFLWDTYGTEKVDANTLTKGAQAFGRELRKRFQEI